MYLRGVRIIAGEFGGRRLLAPATNDTRPTSDRVREALFSILGAPAAGRWVLDIFAGSGGLGLEALSRGAAAAVFIDKASAALKALRENVAALGAGPRSQIVGADALLTLRRATAENGRGWYQGPVGWVFVDPPYRAALAEPVLELLAAAPFVDDGSIVIVEHDRRLAPRERVESLVRTDLRRYGDTEVSFYRRERS